MSLGAGVLLPRRRALTTLLSGAALVGVPTWLQRAHASHGPEPSSYPFALGVASGFPRTSSVSLWTRLATDPLLADGAMPALPCQVQCEVATDLHFSEIVWQKTLRTEPAHAHAVHAWPSGLRAGQHYFYRFHALGATSPVGRTKTAPELLATPQQLRLALASCQHFEAGHFAAHQHLAQQDLDFVLFVGDYIYETNYSKRTRVREHHSQTPPKTLDEFRVRYGQYKADPALQAAHAAHPWVVMWDDHEVENDYANAASWRWTPVAEFLTLRAAAFQAYWEHMPLPQGVQPNGADMTLNTHLPWGQLANLWTLDLRQYRTPHACAQAHKAGGRVVGDCTALQESGRTMLGEAQEHWLQRGIRGARTQAERNQSARSFASSTGTRSTTTAPWNIIAQATQLSPNGFDTPLGRRSWTDGWDGYPIARERLLQILVDPFAPLPPTGSPNAGTAVGSRAADTVVLSGDVHRHMAAGVRLRPMEASSELGVSEYVCSSMTSRGAIELAVASIRASNPDIVHARGDERGYALVTLDARKTQCDFLGTAHPVKAGAALALQARFVTERGRPGPIKA